MHYIIIITIIVRCMSVYGFALVERDSGVLQKDLPATQMSCRTEDSPSTRAMLPHMPASKEEMQSRWKKEESKQAEQHTF